MANFIKQRSFHSRMFKEHLLLHKEIQWLSWGKVLNSVSDLKQQKARLCWILGRRRTAAETSQRGTYSSVPVKYEEMVLTSRDEILGLKRKMRFWKTSCYKKKSWLLSSAAWVWLKRVSASLKSDWKPTGEAAEQNWTDFPSFSTQMYHWWTFFLNLLIVRIWLEKKGRRAAVLYFQDEFYWSAPDKFWISVKKRISHYS